MLEINWNLGGDPHTPDVIYSFSLNFVYPTSFHCKLFTYFKALQGMEP